MYIVWQIIYFLIFILNVISTFLRQGCARVTYCFVCCSFFVLLTLMRQMIISIRGCSRIKIKRCFLMEYVDSKIVFWLGHSNKNDKFVFLSLPSCQSKLTDLNRNIIFSHHNFLVRFFVYLQFFDVCFDCVIYNSMVSGHIEIGTMLGTTKVIR